MSAFKSGPLHTFMKVERLNTKNLLDLGINRESLLNLNSGRGIDSEPREDLNSMFPTHIS